TYLILHERQLRPGSLESLSRLPKLQDLLLLRCQLTRSNLKNVEKLPHLKHLNLEGSTVNDDDLAALNVPNLDVLSLAGTPVTIKGVLDFQQHHSRCRIGGAESLLQYLSMPVGPPRTDGSAVVFDGVKSNVQVANLQFDPDQLTTVEAWVQTPEDPSKS